MYSVRARVASDLPASGARPEGKSYNETTDPVDVVTDGLGLVMLCNISGPCLACSPDEACRGHRSALSCILPPYACTLLQMLCVQATEPLCGG